MLQLPFRFHLSQSSFQYNQCKKYRSNVFIVPQKILRIFQISFSNLCYILHQLEIETDISVSIYHWQQRFQYEPFQYYILEQCITLFRGTYWLPSIYFILLNVFLALLSFFIFERFYELNYWDKFVCTKEMTSFLGSFLGVVCFNLI